MKKYFAAFIAVFLLCITASGCGANSSQSATSTMAAGSNSMAKDFVSTEEIAYDEAMPQESIAGATETGADLPQSIDISAEERKIVYTVDLSLQTTAFNDAVIQLPQLTEDIGGIIQDSYIEGTNLNQKYYARNANFTVRIPSDQLDSYIGNLGEVFHIVSQSKHSSDITRDYYDVQARLNSLRIQQERLTAMLEEASDLQYMLEVERELADVLYQIESITSTLNRMDSSVELSTVSIHLQEVGTFDENQPVVEPATFREQIGQTFRDSTKGFVDFCQRALLFLIALVPFLPLLIVVVVLIIVIRRALRRKRAQTRHMLPNISGSPQTMDSANAPAPQPSDTPDDPT